MKRNCRSDFTKLEARVCKKEIALFLLLLAFGECTCLLLCRNTPGFAEDWCGGGEAVLLTLRFAEEPRVVVSINKPRDGMQEVPK